jgi:hypothetical protein
MITKENNPSKSGNTRTAGVLKINKTCAHLAEFICSTEPIILQMLGIKMRGWMNKLEKLGYVFSDISSLKTAKLWFLTPKGLRNANEYKNDGFKHYPSRPERRARDNLRHDLFIQKVALNYEPYEIQSSFRFQSLQHDWIPDCLVKINMEIRF